MQPPHLADLPAGYTLVAGMGTATVLPDLDFETASEAGFIWNEAAGRWDGPPNAPQNRKGLTVVGVAVYATHPSTRVLSAAYDLKDGLGRRRWLPGQPIPADLASHVATGGLLEAWNSGFEFWIWNHVCTRLHGWPPLPAAAMRCAMAKARAHALPGSLGDAGTVMRLTIQKDADGKRLLEKFSMPRKPTKADPRRWITPADDPTDAQNLYRYNEIDIQSEAEASSKTPDLIPDELAFWQADQAINYRGVAIDQKGVADCIVILEQALERYNTELRAITQGAVEAASQNQRMTGWLAPRGVWTPSLDEDHVTDILKRTDLAPDVRRVLEIKGLIGSASVKKLFAMRNQMSPLGRLHDLFSFHAARTGRATGNGPQPHNLPKSGPDIFVCGICNRFHGAHRFDCPYCGTIRAPGKPSEWGAVAHTDALEAMGTRSLEYVEMIFGDAVHLIGGCLRGLFVAADGHDLLASDYSAIEAVVNAALAGEDWRLQVFAKKEDIYLHSAAKTTGTPYAVYVDHKKRTSQHHPDRQPFGKVSELALGYGGWIGAMVSFGADQYFDEPGMKKNILRWRDESPAIVEFWGGQFRSLPWLPDYRKEYYGLEGAAIQAVLNPGVEFTVQAAHWASRPVTFIMRGDVLYCRLPSTRYLTYHEPRLEAGSMGLHSDGVTLTYMGWNTNAKMGGFGWVRMSTYGGKLCENVVQAVARDVLAWAIIQLERAGYPVVLHVHDEVVAEVLKNWGSIEEFERIMGTMPWWAWGWEQFLRAAGGWRGRRYRKD